MSYTIRTNSSWSATQSDLGETFRKWGVYEWDTNYPRGSRSEKMYQTDEEKSVWLKWKAKDGKEISITMNEQQRAVDNLRVLYLAVEAMRMNETRGINKVLESAYKQLAGGSNSPEIGVNKNSWEILEVSPNASVEVAKAAYRVKALTAHPDKGGSEREMKELNDALAYFQNKS